MLVTHKNALKFMVIASAALSSLSSVASGQNPFLDATQTLVGGSSGSPLSGSHPSTAGMESLVGSSAAAAVIEQDVALAFLEMPRSPSNDHQCISPTNGRASRAPSGLMTAWCQNALSFHTTAVPNATNTYYIKANNTAADNLCIDVAGGVIQKGTSVNLWTCSQSNNQKWVYVIGNGTGTGGSLRPMANQDLCIDVNSGATAPIGSNLILWTCVASVNQNITMQVPELAQAR